MSKERVWNKRWIIWWIYGNGSQLVQCKCVQDKMKFRMGEIIRGEIWEIQYNKSQPQVFYKLTLHELLYIWSTWIISQLYHSRAEIKSSPNNFIPLKKISTVKRISVLSAKRISSSITIFKVYIQISKVLMRISEIFGERIFYENSKFRASQFLNKIHQIKYQFKLIFELLERMKIIVDNNKFTNLSKDFWKCLP